MKTIFVDDEPWMRLKFESETKDIEKIELVASFQNPLKALEFAASNPVELAFLDLEMPRMNGIELAKRLRELLPDIGIVFVSAYDSAIVCARNDLPGCGYLMKPYNEQTLCKALDTVRPGKGGENH